MDTVTNIERLKGQLTKALEKTNLNYGEILSLSSQLAKEDTKFVRFSANATLIKRLGSELVARQETAVSELIKNAYDADATVAEAVFNCSAKAGGRLIITDNGSGMTRDQLIDGFMRLATSDKIDSPVSKLYGRRRAGRKGIGRFAAQRLGKKLTLITQTAGSSFALKVVINWNLFEQSGELFEIPSEIVEVPKEMEQGTILIIDGLREGWTDPEISRVYRYVEALIQPFPLSKTKDRLTGKERDPGFKATFNRLVGVKKVEIASEDKMLFDFAVAKVTGTVDEKGKGSFHLEAPRFKEDSKEAVENARSANGKFSHLKNIRFVANYFIFSRDFIPTTQFARIQNLSASQGGIRLYRNGFRVLPFGEPYNDWLNLNAAESKREVLPPIANKNWFGFVELNDYENSQFEETSSREGLTLTPVYHELVEFVHGALRAAAIRIASLRGRKQTAGQKDFITIRTKENINPLDQAINKIQQVANDLESPRGSDRGYDASHGAEALRNIVGVIRKAKNSEDTLLQELAMLRILASLGLSIGMFTHEVKSRLIALRSELIPLLAGKFSSEITKRIIALKDHASMLEAYTLYFDATVSDSANRARQSEDLSELIHTFYHQFHETFEKRGIKIEAPEIEGDDFITTPLHVSEIGSVLVNFLTNSAKAIARAKPKDGGKIKIRLWRENKRLLIDFADNGDGIAEQNKERIFDAFFTTTHTARSIGSNSDELTGTGLGLKIVYDIISSLEGDVYLTSAPKGFTTCFRAEIPAAEEHAK